MRRPGLLPFRTGAFQVAALLRREVGERHPAHQHTHGAGPVLRRADQQHREQRTVAPRRYGGAEGQGAQSQLGVMSVGDFLTLLEKEARLP